MDLKAFKGLPHEFGGIDYTEGSEVEGGEFAVNIGKSGNEYIFDKNSSEGEKLSKEFKRLDANGRLSEDDPLALEAFDQIAREEALKHAQRSVNEKGIDPFRNMYEQGGQAANGGVKYAAGGAKDMYFTGGVAGGFNTSLLTDMMGGADGILAMSNPNYSNPNNPNNPNNFGEDVGEVYPEGAFKGVSAPTPVSDVNNLTGSNAPQQSLATDPMTSMTSMPTMETIPTIDSYQLPTEPLPEMPTADASYNVTSGINDSTGESQGGSFGDSMGNIQKAFQIGGDVMQAFSPETKQGRDWQITEKGNTRQRSIAPKYAYSTGAEMMGAAMSGAGQGAQIGKMAGPAGAAIGAAAGMVISPLMKGLQDKKAARQLDLAFKSELAKKNAEERLDDQIKAIGRDVDYRGKIDKDRYAGLNQLGTSSKEGGALPKNKGVYGYYANGGGVGNPTTGAELVEQMRYKRGVNTLDSGITYQDLQDARSYPVYDEAGNEMVGVRNIGASSMSPGFNVRTNTPQSRVAASPQLNNTMRMQEMPARPLARQSAPQYYAPTAQDPCGNYGLNQNVKQGFNLYNEPLKYAQKGNYYNPESLQKNEFVGPPEFSGEALVGGNYNNPDLRPTSTLINNETGESYQFQDGGGKKKEEELLTGPTGPQGVIGAEGVIGPSTGYSTSNQVSSEDFSSDPGMIPVRRDNTCVKGMNCFEDIAGMDVIPNWIANNRDLEKFLNSPEGKKAYEQVSAIDAKAGDMVQFTRPVDVTNPKTGAKEAASYALNYGGNPLNYPYHVGLMNSDSTYIGDGDKELPLHEKSIYMDDDKRFDFESAGIFGDAAKFFMTDDNKKKANYYRLKDKEARQKQLDVAIKAKKDGVDISRQLYKNETPTGYVGNPYYNSRGFYPSAY